MDANFYCTGSDYAPETRNQFVETIYYLLKRQKEIGRMIPTFSNGDVMHGCFVKQNGISELNEEDRLNYMYANMMKVGQNESWYVFLKYDELDKLEDVIFKKLYIEDIDKEGYDKEKLEKYAEFLYQNRVMETLKKRRKKKIYPNEICPCGSGKKYKKCCGNCTT